MNIPNYTPFEVPNLLIKNPKEQTKLLGAKQGGGEAFEWLDLI